MEEKFKEFLKIQRVYDLKNISRMNTHNYFCAKINKNIERKETTAEHVYSSMKLADYFLTTEKEFNNLDKLKVYDILLYHDDCEIISDDTPIADRESRNNKEIKEIDAIQDLKNQYPIMMGKKLESLDNEFRTKKTLESKFSKAIDKMDALIHELKYPEDWAKKGFNEENVRMWFFPSFQYSKTFTDYFENIISYLNNNGHFDE